MAKFYNKTVVITGGNSGIGLATAYAFQENGASVAIFGRNKDTMKTALKTLDQDTMGTLGDVQNLSDIKELFRQVNITFGQIDTLIVNAGEGKEREISQVDEQFFDTVSNINFKGAYFTAHSSLPYMKDGGSIIFISSAARKKGLPGLTVYSAAKAAVRSLARSLAVELAHRQIRVNSISPGGITSPFLSRDGFPPHVIEKSIKEYNGVTPLNRMGTPQEIALVALFLASPEASYINGSDIAVDGGYAQI